MRTKFELMIESFYIANQFALFNQKELNERVYPIKIYIIPMKWFEKWKNYTNYTYFLSDSKIDIYLKIGNEQTDITSKNLKINNRINIQNAKITDDSNSNIFSELILKVF